MRAVVQRVAASRVEIGGETVGEIGQGLMILLGVSGEDTEEEMRFLAKKIVNLRIFTDIDINRIITVGTADFLYPWQIQHLRMLA